MSISNVNKLILHKISIDAIPFGTTKSEGLAAGLDFLLDRDRVTKTAKHATAWVTYHIQAIRDAIEPNPWKNATDEVIAGEILRKIEEIKISRVNNK